MPRVSLGNREPIAPFGPLSAKQSAHRPLPQSGRVSQASADSGIPLIGQSLVCTCVSFIRIPQCGVPNYYLPGANN